MNFITIQRKDLHYCSTNPEVRKLLDRPIHHEWIEWECDHINKQLDVESDRLKLTEGNRIPHYEASFFNLDALEWQIWYDEVARGGHEVVTLLLRMADRMPVIHHRFLHRGLTSSDLIDGCNHIRWQRLCSLYSYAGGKLHSVAADAYDNKDPIMGMTHGMRAYKKELGARFTAIFWDDRSLWHRGEHPGPWQEGPVGTQYRRQCHPRQDYWALWAQLARRAYGLEILATDYRFYCSDLYRGTGVAGNMDQSATSSSCMPGKVNPSPFERCCSVGYMIRTLCTAQMLQPPMWLDRDLVHSALERETIHRIWEHSFWLIEEMTRLIFSVNLSVIDGPLSKTSHDLMNDRLDEGDSYKVAREKSCALPPG